MKPEADLIIHNSSQLLTIPPNSAFGIDSLGAIPGGAVAVKNGLVLETGSSAGILSRYCARETIDAGGRLLMPGFVDSHTHLIHGGDRTGEMVMRLKGATYLEILKTGGGIHSTVKATRQASQEDLTARALERLNHMADHGTTTVEIKSGYGLDTAAERKILKCAASLNRSSALEIVSTYLGAHSLPKDRHREKVMKDLTGPSLRDFRLLSEYCDVFCEEGAFTLEESRTILTAAKAAGFGLKIHAGQFNALGGAGMAASLGAVSADHLEELVPGEAKLMAKHGTVAVLLPGVPFFLQGKKYADGRRLIDAGVTVALATDYNPGSCPSYSMPFMIALGVFQCGLTVSEAIRAATLGGASAINREDRIGSLMPGMQADILILNLEKPAEIPYYFGTNPVHRVFKRGLKIL
ncbi:MAG: imidazolonepropionase [Spirochaetales bacterium]|nr:imidazolonepropionase [Spirochaetales bacterium]